MSDALTKMMREQLPRIIPAIRATHSLVGSTNERDT
jgi:hypothetical protein